MTTALQQLLDRHRDGHALEREFYMSGDVFEHDRQAVLLKDWFIAGTSGQCRGAGDYITLAYSGESIIVVRGDDGVLRAFLNVCRHRGSRICAEAAGHAKRLVCPYHAWAYTLEGKLCLPRGAPAGFDAAEHPLRALACIEASGLVLVNFWRDAPLPRDELSTIDRYLGAYDLGGCKVAAERRYRVGANWKLVAENFFECYHCLPAHPEFCRTRTSLAARPDRARLAADDAAFGALSRACGLPEQSIEPEWRRRQAGIPFVGYFRNYLRESHATMSRSGAPIGPLLGRLPRFDYGETDILFGPNSHVMAYGDHAVLFQFLPHAPLETEIVTLWLVRDDADVDVEALIELWDVTTTQDLCIIEANQAGVSSAFYEPGPYMEPEADTRGLVDWYLSSLGRPAPDRPRVVR